MTDRCNRAVSGVDHRVRWEWPEHTFDTGLQGFKASSREIGAADRSAKEHIATQHHQGFHFTHEINDVSRRMPRDIEYFEVDPSDRNSVAFLHKPVGRRTYHIQS